MKTNLIRKFKWYIVGFILVVIMLSVGLSFCVWDDYSLKAVSANGKTGNYAEKPDRLYELADDKYSDDNFTKGSNNIANIGDIVTFGKYYQTAKNTSTKTALRWIVVEKQGTTLTLLAESVVAFGSFWGNQYYNGSSWVYGTQANGTYYQNYEQSTIRAWLNSSATRNDGGPQINGSGIFAGFLNEAFSTEEQEYIIAQNISGMRGAKKDDTSTKENYNAITGDKVWIPSYTQVYGDTAPPDGSWKECKDGSQNPTANSKFSYFSNNPSRIGKTTAFASSSVSNYTWNGATHNINMQYTTTAGSAVWWWLRSPNPSYYFYALSVDSSGANSSDNTNGSNGGVRPAVCVQL